jgi:hypothetical protein
MKIAVRAVAVSFLAAGTACSHLPGYQGPAYDFRKSAVAAEPGKKSEGALPNGDSENRFAYRIELGAKGALIASATPRNPAARLRVEIYAGGADPVARGDAGKKVETGQLAPGPYWAVVSEPWNDRVETEFSFLAVFKPADPDQLSGPSKVRSGARDLPADNGRVSDRVDYSGMKRTSYWRIDTPGEGTLKIAFEPQGPDLVAEIEGTGGAPQPIDPAAGYQKKDLPAGEYFVRVYAKGPGDAGAYRLSTVFEPGDPCRNGGPACAREGAEELKLPQDSKVGDVDFKKAKQRHYYKASLKERGRLTIVFKVLEPRGSKVQALFLRAEEHLDQGGERIVGTATKEIDAPGDYFIEVAAPATGDFARYALQTTWQPANFVSGEVVELGRNPCLLTVQAGTNQGVRAGAACTIVVGTNPAAIDSCVVDQAFPNLCKVRPLGAGCRIPNQNVKVQISQ